MLSHANIFILLVLLKYLTFIRFILADDGSTTLYEYNNVVSVVKNNFTLTAPNIPEIAPIKQYEENLTLPSLSLTPSAKNNTIATSAITNSTASAEEFLPIAEHLVGSESSTLNIGKLPEFPKRPDAVYFIVAVAGGSKLWGRTLARTLLDMGPPFGSPQGPPLRPLYVDLPQNGKFSVKVLLSLCQQSDGQALAGVVVIGDGQSARAIALAGSAMSLPVLWAKGGTANLDGMNREIPTRLQAMLQPSSKEILEAIRALFLQTHWHSFFVLSDVVSTMVITGNEGGPLREPPLVPTILPLLANNDDIFRQLAQISRSTRGVVLLLCNIDSARKIMSEAQNLNMVGGHFIWLWADTSSTTEFFEAYQGTGALDLDKSDEDMMPKSKPSEPKLEKVSSTNERHHYHDLLERKMDFEDLNPYRQKTNNDQKSQQHKPADRYIFGLNGDRKRQDDSDYDEFGALRKRDSEIKKKNQPNNNNNNFRNSESQEHFFLTNLDNPDDNLDYLIDNNNEKSIDDVDRVVDAKPKRTSASGGEHHSNMNVTSHVLFHHFKDFPIGLLALRPVRMNVDRHFIRSAVRLFASTWAKIDIEARAEQLMEQRSALDRVKNKLNRNRNMQTIRKQINNKRKRNANFSDLLDGSSNEKQLNNFSTILLRNNSSNSSSSSSNINSDRTFQVNSNFVNSSDLTNNYNNKLKNSRNNQILSGLINKKSNTKSNNKKNINTNNLDLTKQKKKLKRHAAWPSSAYSSPSSSQYTSREDDDSFRRKTPHYIGGCYGYPTKEETWNSEYFAGLLREASRQALSGQKIYDGSIEKSLSTHFELLNLVPDNNRKPVKSFYNHEQFDGNRINIPLEENPTKWRRVGLVSGHHVHLDTIVWPGGDIVVSGLSARARSVFRVVTALAPPFVMESELDEDGLCLRGLPCHRLQTTGKHNLTLMFNAMETRDRLEEDAVEHGNEMPSEPEQFDEKLSYITRCCYGLSMDILDNIATELGFEFHLYIVRDELFGTKYRNFKDWVHNTRTNKAVPEHHKANIPKVYSDLAGGGSGGAGGIGSGVGGDGNSAAERKSNLNSNRNNKSGKNRKYPTNSNSIDDQWNGIVGDLVSGSADMSFAPLTVTKVRAEVIDFSAPYFHSGVTLLAAPQTKSEIPLLAFLLPFSPELWIAIFTSLNITAIAVAVYEWLSPFGLNPWGRQRSKNFSISSALWVMWGLLCGHLVAFKAPKSWPNKFLINVWGGFSVIFVASYTANIAALIAGLFFHNAANSYDASLHTQRVGSPVASAAEWYVQSNDKYLWEHMKKYSLGHIEDGIRGLKNGSLDLIMADSPILDYYRATDHGCMLQRIGETYVDDAYAIGMTKGFPLKDSISALIAKYSSNGYLDILTEKWYGGLPCFKFEADIVQPRPLGVAAVAGVFLLLGLGMALGVIILIFEHWFYKYALPHLRLKPKGTVWKSRNIMFFSQKLYRFINCVELVSPHHAARELVHSIRQGQIASLFQKSIKRKEDEQRRRRKSKAQFFEMIQEIRRVQQNERQSSSLDIVTEVDPTLETHKSPQPVKPKPSPKPKLFSALRRDGRSRSNSSVLSIRRFSTDSILGERLDTIGRRLSRDITQSPPDLGSRRFETFGKGDSASKFDTFSGGSKSIEDIGTSSSGRFDTFSGKKSATISTERPELPIKNKKLKHKRPPLNFESYHRDQDVGSSADEKYELPVVKEGLEPPIYQEDRSKAILKDKMHRELRAKYGPQIVLVDDGRPPLPKKMNAERLAKHRKSMEKLEVRNGSSSSSSARPTPSPRQRRDTNPDDLKSNTIHVPTPNTHKPRTPQMSFERLSREDLLRLSHSSQSEIHEYLKNTMTEFKSDPP